MTSSSSNSRLALRLAGLVIGIVIGIAAGNFLARFGDAGGSHDVFLSFGLAIGGIGYLLGPHISRRLVHDLRTMIVNASALDIVATGAGLAFGALVSAGLAFPLSFLPAPLGSFLPIIAAIAACALSITVAWLRKRDIVAFWLRMRPVKSLAPLAPAAKAIVPELLLDTNVLIDGRIADVVRTGFVTGKLVVPRFVLDELQYIADSDDPARRSRGRRGLDQLDSLRSAFPDQYASLDVLVPEERAVDAKLVRLAKLRKARILTNDFNLNRVAEAQGVNVLNLNELTNSLRPVVLPGQNLSIKLVQEGRELGQAVGFLDDGTTVVVDGGRPWIGTEVSVVVTRLLQTGAGRMIFAAAKHAA